MAGSVFFGNFAAANPTACPAGQVPGLVPGVCYPAGMPPTTVANVDAWQRAVPAQARGAFVQFRATPRTPAEATAFLAASANGAWNAWKAAGDLPAQLKAERPSAFDLTEALLGETGLKQFIQRFDQQVADWRRRWDRLYPSLTALRSYLGGLPPQAAIPAEATVEVVRQAILYQGFAAEIDRVSRNDYGRQIRAIISARREDASLLPSLELGLETISKAAAAAIRAALDLAINSVLKPALGALVPKWLWFVLIGVGGLAVYGVVTGNPLVGAARRALRRG